MQMWSPLPGIQVGAQIYDNAMRQRLIDQQIEDANSMRQALGMMGQGEQFAGFEDMPEAKRPDWLRQAYQVNPQAALQMEQRLAAPYAQKRDIAKQGEIEAAKRRADAEVWGQMAERFGFAPPSAPQADVPPIVLDGENGPISSAEPMQGSAPMAAPGAPSNAITPERTFELTPHGPKMGVKMPSGLDQFKVQDERRLAQEDLNLRQKAETRQGEEFGFNRSKAADEQVARINTQIRENRAQLVTVMQQREMGNMTPQEAYASSQALKAEIKGLEASREQVLRGTRQTASPMTQAPSGLPSSTPKAKATPQAVPPGPVQTAPAQAQASQPQPAPMAANPQAGLTYKQETELAQKNAEQKMTAANKDIEEARNSARLATRYYPVAKEMADLVFQNELGHPGIASLPGGETALKFYSPKLADLQKLHDTLTNMFAQPGQSQLMNTIIERQMVASMIPSMDASPDMNRKNAARLLGFTEQMQQLPDFLEKWASSHHGALDGSTEAWLEYARLNQPYLYREGQGRHVQVVPNKSALSVGDWMGAKEMGLIKIIRTPDGQERVLRKEAN